MGLARSRAQIDSAARTCLSPTQSVDSFFRSMNGDVSVVLVNHGGPTRVTLRLDDILKGDEDSPANSLWEASSSTLRPAKGSDETLQNWARPVTQGLHVDLSNGAVHVDVPETSIVSVRIVRRTRGGDAEQVRVRAFKCREI